MPKKKTHRTKNFGHKSVQKDQGLFPFIAGEKIPLPFFEGKPNLKTGFEFLQVLVDEAKSTMLTTVHFSVARGAAHSAWPGAEPP